MMDASKADMVRRLSAPVPRYTSYPTAPHFHEDIGEMHYRDWLSSLPENEHLSLYVHVPFCDKMCWFCGCHTKQINRYDPIPPYMDAVYKELELVRDAIGFPAIVKRIHLGGGSPSMLQRAELDVLRGKIRQQFRQTGDCEISIEIDPSDLSGEEFEIYRTFGVTRASIGVQDFDERVQTAINRPQSFEQTSRTVEGLRRIGVKSINIDALYGLPYQTSGTISDTIGKVISLAPDRVALFGYAHVPWMKPNQRLIPEPALPDALERLHQARLAADMLQDGGYVQIGIDHFAKPEDGLAVAAAESRLHRNFQGYTDDACSSLVGIGASSIGRLPAGYVQNETATGTYMRKISSGRLPVSRGVELTDEDRLNADIIEQLMCGYSFDVAELRTKHGEQAQTLPARIEAALSADTDELAEFDGNTFRVLPQSRTFVRTVASWFDARMREKAARYSMAV